MFTKEILEKITDTKIKEVTFNPFRIEELVEDYSIKKDDFLIISENGSIFIDNIHSFINTICMKWAYDNGYYLTINYAPAVTMIYPKEIDTQEFKPFSKGSNIIEAMANLCQWILKVRGE